MNRERLDNLRAFLTELEQKGISFRLVGGEFRAKPCDALTEDLATGIDVCRESLTIALCIEKCICIDCRQRPAKRSFVTYPFEQGRLYCEECYWKRVRPVMDRLKASKNIKQRDQDEQIEEEPFLALDTLEIS